MRHEPETTNLFDATMPHQFLATFLLLRECLLILAPQILPSKSHGSKIPSYDV